LTLSSTVHRLLRSTIMQLSLPLLENPPLNSQLWEHLDAVQRAVILNQLAQLITKTAETETGQEAPSHE
jgi:hypothetical protein